MPDNDILNAKPSDTADFDLPPLPTRPVKLTGDQDAPRAEVNVELPQRPANAVKRPLFEDDEPTPLPEIPSPIAAAAPPPPPVYEPEPEPQVEESIPEPPPMPAPPPPMPKMPEPPPMPKMPASMANPEPAPEPAPAPKPKLKMPEKPAFMKTEKKEKPAEKSEAEKLSEAFSFEYTESKIDPDSVKLAPMHSSAEMSARNKKEAQKMSSLAEEVGNGPLLDDLSDEYKGATEIKSEELIEKNKLDDDEKRLLKQRLAADLGARPKNFNQRASQGFYNKLMEEQKLKTSRKGFAISIIPIFMGLGSAALAFFKLNWGEDYTWFPYVAPFMALAAIMLLIKSKHVKLLSVSIYAVVTLIYLIPGLIFFTKDNPIQGDNIIHVLFVIGAIALNVISILILIKNEAVITYYSTNIKRKR